MKPDTDLIVRALLEKAEGATRFLVAIAGPPGAGKSTLAEALCQSLRLLGDTAVVLPMDGFHMDNGLLRERGLLARKGSPQTFDVRGLEDVLKAVRTGEKEVLIPVFDRDRELAIAAACAVLPGDRFILAEGNYLLLDEGEWSGLAKLFDYSIFVAPSVETLERRLRARWVHHGLVASEIEAKLHDNDLPNGRLVLSRSRPADILISER